MLSTRKPFVAFSLRFFFLLALIPATFASATISPVPLITSISPISAAPGGAQFTLTVNGANFVVSSVVKWNATALVTTFVSADQLTAVVPATLIVTGGTGHLTVANSTLVSNVFFFPVGAPISTITTAAFSPAVGSLPSAAATADLNADGNLDLIISNRNSGTVSVLLGNGDGTFQPQKLFTSLAIPWGIAVGDLNGDGIPDLVIGTLNSGLNIALGNGDGTFTVTNLTQGNCPSSPVLADVNGDGKLDIIVGNECGSGILVFLGNGNGTFQAPTTVSGSSDIYSLVVADFNGDGILDIAAANRVGSASVDVYKGTGSGNFAAVVHYPALAGAWSVAAGDFNGDGKLDLVVTSSAAAGIAVLLGNGDATFQPETFVATTGNYYAVRTGDINSDGKQDIVTLTSTTVQAWPGNGDGTFQAPQSMGSAFGIYGLALGDFQTAGGLGVAATSTSTANVFVPTALLTPSTQAFGSVGVGSSTQKIFTLTNSTSLTLAISGITFTGTNPTDFTELDTCATPLPSGGTCAVTVTFTPAASGARSAALSIADNALGGPQISMLSGTGASVPVAGLSTSAVAFGNQSVGVRSASMPVVLTNTGTAALSGLAASIIGTNISDFAQTNNCPASLGAGLSCTYNVTFTPGALGARSASLQLTDNAANSPQLVTLSGTGIPIAASKLLYIAAPPSTVQAGSSVGTISVGVYSATSVLDTASTASIVVTITGPNSFSQNQTQAAVSGVATFNFTAVPMNLAGQYTVTASSTGLTSALANTTVTAQASSAVMRVTGFPSPTYSTVTHNFAVSVTDAFLNPITTYVGTVTLSSTDTSATLAPSPYTFISADMGVHAFSGTLVTAGTESISATDGTLLGVQSGIVVNALPQLIVNTLTDDSGGSPCNGTGVCSLRSAITQSNTLGAGNLTVDTSQFTGSSPWTSTLTGGVLLLNSNVTITGPGATELTISGDNASSVFQVSVGANVSIEGLSVVEGASATNGGGISNAGSLTLDDVTVSNSTAVQNGGGLYSTGTLTVNSSTISANTATLNGGGVATTGTSVFYDSTIAGNAAGVNGGGIDNSGPLSVPQSTFFGNSAVDGSGIENEPAGTLNLVQSTLSGNTSSSQTGGSVTNLNATAGSVTIANSIVSGNTAFGGDCVACGTQSAFNLFNGTPATLKLGTLASNGGSVQTMLPLFGSPAIAAGSVAIALNPGVPQSLAFDQRGTGFARVINNTVDLGAAQDNSGPATSLAIAVSGIASAGTPFNITLNAFTATGTPAGSYTGTVHFTSSDPLAVLPADYTFLAADGGTHVFSITLETSGSETVSVVDTGNAALEATQSVNDSPAAASALVIMSGSDQTAAPSTAFAVLLVAKVTDTFGNGVPGTTVVLSAPASGAGGTFAVGGISTTLTTNINGLATATVFTANATTGQYSVSGTSTGLTAVSFALTNSVLPDYSITANPISLTIVEGQSGTSLLTVTPVGGYAGTISFSCAGLPAHANCVFLPAQLVMTGNNTAATAMLTINTTGNNGVLSQLQPLSLPRIPTAFGTVSSVLSLGLLLSAVLLGIKTAKQNNRFACAILFLLFAATAGLGLIGCGQSTVSSGTAPGQYSATIKATAGGSSHSAAITIIIKTQ
jgi:CSLREA domain-containing protein